MFSYVPKLTIPEITYAKSLNTRARRALHDNLGGNEQLALAVDAVILRTKRDGWRGNMMKEKEIRYAIRGFLGDEALTNHIFELVKQQHEY